MADRPTFTSTPIVWAGATPGSAETGRSGSLTNVTTLGTAAAAGTKIERIVAKVTGTVDNGVVCLFLYDGSTYHLFDEIRIEDNGSGPDTTTITQRWEKLYEDLVLPSGWSLRCTGQVANNTGDVRVIAFGGDLT